MMYEFVRATVLKKTTTLLEHSAREAISPVHAISKSADAGSSGFLQDMQVR